jgi:hypothetical protein
VITRRLLDPDADSPDTTTLSLDLPCGQARAGTRSRLQRGADTVRVGLGKPLDETMTTPLQYFQPSPVRGQLEPPDASTRPGWRYLQCTDTPNELKGKQILMVLSPRTDPGLPVLLPPRASQVFAYLLSQEQVELSRGAEASWERLMHIRHLKDRMIREHSRLSQFHQLEPSATGKCRRLARLSPAHGKEAQFRTLYAPPDFALKARSFSNGTEQSLNLVLGTREMVQE